MALAPELDSRLRSAHFDAFVPILVRLGVRTIADLEHVQESDFENQESITNLHKQMFGSWKQRLLQDESKPTKPSNSSSNILMKTCPTPEGLPEALFPYGSKPRDAALNVDFDKIFANPSLSGDDVKWLYHDLCKKHHPDKGGDAEVFARITRAYTCVMDPTEYYLNLQAPITLKQEEDIRDETRSMKADTISEKSGSMHVDGSFMPRVLQRRGFRASLKLCCASIVHRRTQ